MAPQKLCMFLLCTNIVVLKGCTAQRQAKDFFAAPLKINVPMGEKLAQMKIGMRVDV